MHIFNIAQRTKYTIKNPQQIQTPSLLVFKNSVFKNIKRMESYLAQIAPNSGFKNLCPHVKTNKSAYVTKLMMQKGIHHFKCTPNEIDMLLQAGAKSIFVAYPLLEHNAKYVAQKMKKSPDVSFQVQIGSLDHAEILNKIALENKISWDYFIDIDVGMHRTGIDFLDVFKLYEKISQFKNLHFTGFHGYDGHNHYKDKNVRIETSEKSMSIIIHLYKQFKKQNIFVQKIMVAGSPSFLTDFEILHKNLPANVEVFVSPGTWIYWDSQYDNLIPGEFEFAALILAQVMDKGKNQITLNLGHKRWAADQGEIQLFSKPELKLKSFSEEHTVLSTSNPSQYKIGEYILIVPRHVCPTVNLYENFTLIGKDGEIENLSTPIDARNK
jgi:D-serine deaminase-like pyridoxal phosphate-dependent protein